MTSKSTKKSKNTLAITKVLKERILLPTVPLPSVKLCIASTPPMSVLGDRAIDQERRKDYFNELNTDTFLSRVDGSSNLDKKIQVTKSIRQLKDEEYILKALLKYLQIGIWNKLQIYSLYELDVGDVYKDFFGLYILHHNNKSYFPCISLIRALLTSHGKKAIDTRLIGNFSDVFNKFSHSCNSQICLDKSPLSPFNTKLETHLDSIFNVFKGYKCTKDDKVKIMTEEEMYNNLMQGKLCNGNPAAKPYDLAISLTFGNKYDLFSPGFIQLIVEENRIIDAIKKGRQDQ